MSRINENEEIAMTVKRIFELAKEDTTIAGQVVDNGKLLVLVDISKSLAVIADKLNGVN